MKNKPLMGKFYKYVTKFYFFKLLCYRIFSLKLLASLMGAHASLFINVSSEEC